MVPYCFQRNLGLSQLSLISSGSQGICSMLLESSRVVCGGVFVRVKGVCRGGLTTDQATDTRPLVSSITCARQHIPRFESSLKIYFGNVFVCLIIL